MTSTLPRLTADQRRSALRVATEARKRRAEVKRAMKRGEVSMADALAMDEMQRCRARDAIGSMPGYGSARTSALMKQLGIDWNRRIGGLGPRQRAALAEVFADVD